MPLPPGFIDELRSRLTVSEIVGKRVKLTRAGREFKACCPFHKEKSPSFTINDQKGFFHCFGCGAHGDAIGFLMQSENRSFMEAVEILAQQAGMVVPRATEEDIAVFEKEKTLHALIEDAARWFEEQLVSPAGRLALKYLKDRKLSDETIARFRLGFAPNDGQALIAHLAKKGYAPEQMVEAGLAKKAENEDRTFSFFRSRVIFPVGDRRGRVVAFGGRVLEGDGPKYINSADHGLFHKGQLLYGYSRARAAAAGGLPLIITEGYMDVIRLVEAGFMGAVAPLGTALTEDQMLLLWKIIPKPPVRPDLLNHIPILCFDGDEAGMKAASRALERILPHIGADQSVRFAAMPCGEDPDSLILKKGPAAMQAAIEAALPLVDFLWQNAASGRRLDTPEDRAGMRRTLYEATHLIRDRNLQQDYQNEIQRRLQQDFAPQYQQRFQGGRNKAFAGGRPAWMPFIKPRALPDHLQERIVLALLINHPSLFAEMEDALHSLPFSDKNMEALRQAIFEFRSDHESSEAEGLRDHLEKSGFGASLKKILGEELYVHAGFAKASRPLELARAGWHDIWRRHLRRQLEDELKNASLELKATGDAETLQRIEELQNLLRDMEQGEDQEEMVV